MERAEFPFKRELLSAYVDGECTPSEKALIESDTENLRAAQALRSVALRVRNTAALYETAPDSLRLNIRSALRAEVESKQTTMAQAVVSKESFLSRFIATIVQPFVAIPTLTTLAIVVFVLVRSGGSESEGSFRAQSFSNFHAVMDGTLKLQKATNNFDELSSYFKQQGVNYPVINPCIKAPLVGGVVSEYKGHKFAHLVFQHNGHYVYLYEAPEQSFVNKVLEMPSALAEYVSSGKWYTETAEDQTTWMFWRIETTYCSVVADLNKEELNSLFIGA